MKEIQPKVYIVSVSHVIYQKVKVAVFKDSTEYGYNLNRKSEI